MSLDNSDEPSSPVSEPTSTRRSYRRVWLLVIGLLCAAGFFLFQRQGNAQPNARKAGGPPPAVPIAATTARTGDIADFVNALGYVTPLNTVTVRTRVDGQLINVNYKEGEIVDEGKVLAQIDPRLFEAQLAQAEGQRDRDKAQLEQARIDLNRYTEAYSKNAIPKQQLDLQQATVYQLEGTLKIDQAQIDSASVNLLYCTIKAPISGRVGLRLVDPGNIVHAGDANGLLVITQLRPITVVFGVAEDHLPEIRHQLRSAQRLAVDALDRTQQNKLATGWVSALDNQIDATTGTVRLKAIFGNSDDTLFPNQFVNARLLVKTEHGVTLVPTAAIQRNGDATFVYVIKPDHTAEMRNVTVGTTDGDVTAVEGVKPGEVVATDGFDKLRDGVNVTVREGGDSGDGGEDRSQQDGKSKGPLESKREGRK